MKSRNISPARFAAFEILRRVDEGAYASVLLAANDPELNSLDRALCHEIVMGVLRRRLWLDRLIELFSGRDLTKLDAAVVTALRMGLYQLRFLSRVPASAAVNESVNLVHRARVSSASSLVNAVMRRAARELEVDPASDIQDPFEVLAVDTSHPRWLIERWIAAFGWDEAAAFARANNKAASVAFRVVSNLGSEADVLNRLRAAGAELVPSKIAAGAWRVSGAGGVVNDLAASGEIYIQDEASQLVAYCLDLKPGQRVLDVCAAPGSKTTHIGNLTRDEATVVAGDLHLHRLRTVTSSMQTQALTSIHCVALDALNTLPFPEKSFDRVLVDAPCSGTGTLRRNPEIRWRLTAADIKDLSARQTRILTNAARVVAPGGRLVYSTCSVEPEENEHVVLEFLEKFGDFKWAKLAVPPSLITPDNGAARTWPHRDGTDGFFVQAFERKF